MAHHSKKRAPQSRSTGSGAGQAPRGGAPNSGRFPSASNRAQSSANAESHARGATPSASAPKPRASSAARITGNSGAMPTPAERPALEAPDVIPTAATPLAADVEPGEPVALEGAPAVAHDGASGPFWRTWSNRRILSVGVVAIGVAIVLSLLLRGLLTPVATATPNLHATPLPPDPLINHFAPATTMVDLSGNRVQLSSLKGKIVVLNFWYAECDPCRYEMPALEKAYQTYQAKGVVIVGIDPVDSAQTASSYAHSLGITYPITLDQNLRTVQSYKVFDTPTTFFIDRQGVIRYKSVGSLTTATLNTDLKALLAQH